MLQSMPIKRLFVPIFSKLRQAGELLMFFRSPAAYVAREARMKERARCEKVARQVACSVGAASEMMVARRIESMISQLPDEE